MAVSSCYSVEDVIAAVINADSYRNKAADTGHFIFIDTVIDAELALKSAGISDSHLKILYYRWVYGLTQAETGRLFGRPRESIARIEARSKQKLQVVVDQWSAEEDV